MGMFDWAPLTNCMDPYGEGYVETNYVIGSRKPSINPSASGRPTARPSTMPTSYSPTVSPSIYPSATPTMIPTESPTKISSGTMVVHQASMSAEESTVGNNGESTGGSDALGQHNEDFLVQLLSWANADLEAHRVHRDSIAASIIKSEPPTHQPSSSSFAISELTLPAIADATISQKRFESNFGPNSALAIGRVSNGERFDALLKFDIGLAADDYRPIESAILRIHAAVGCANGGTFTITSDTSWDQHTVSWDTAPAADSLMVGALGSLSDETWYELDLLPVLTALWKDASLDYLGIRVETPEDDLCMYSALESGEKAPYITIKYGSSNNDVIERKQRPRVIPQSNAVARPFPAGQFLLLRATDDSTIDASEPYANLSEETYLRAAFHSETRQIFDFIIRFDLSEMLEGYDKANEITPIR